MDPQQVANAYTQPGNAITGTLKFLQNLFILEKNFLEEAYPSSDNDIIRNRHIETLRQTLTYKLPDGTVWRPE